ncbi:MAG: T9SS type A sorting domain-containing protein, partial [Chitinophagales bacterium]|nr:T9SS type A sorting domain-containing protein [Chitinophagales bacterium]
FISSKYDANQPLLVNVGFIAFDFAYSINSSSGHSTMRLFFHGGGRTFLSSVTSTSNDDVRLEIEDYLPDSTINTAWWGCNPSYDILNDANNVPPTTGINVNFSQQKINRIISWAIKNLPIDSNRIYIDATSDGSAPGFLYALTYPERIAAVEVHTGAFNLSFLTDWISNCSLNTGYKNREEVDNLLGEVSTNLMCNLGIPTFNALNGGWIIHQYQSKEFPMIFSVNGKNDQKLGWTEKTIFYDSLNNNRLGGYFFWDNRDHSGNNKFWNVDNYNLYRYRRNVSFPAFSFCSLNEDWGDGTGTTGANYGSVNGMLDWNDSAVDESSIWEIKALVRDLTGYNGSIVVYPDSCTADLTPKRLQNFKPAIGTTLTWKVVRKGKVKQSGTIIYNGGLITLPQVKIYKDTSHITISIEVLNTYYRDNDGDNYGDPLNTIQAETIPNGYVINNSDCNDANAAVHPGATDVCNGIDDNCNSLIDENAFTATVTPNGTISFCDGSSVLLTANGGVGLNYQWIKGTKNISGATNQTYSANQAKNYKVSETNSYSCASTSEATTLTLLSAPTATITPLGNLDICVAGSVTLQANSGVGYIYAWKKGSSFLNGETNQNYVATKTGTFKVQVTNSSGCSKTSTGVKVTKSCKASDKMPDENKGVTIYPNPANDFATIKFNLQQTSLVNLKIYDLNGKKVQTIINKELEPGNHEELINISSLTSGMYLFKLICDEGIYNIPFIIQ